MANLSQTSNTALAVWLRSQSPGITLRPKKRFDNAMASFAAALKDVDRNLSIRFENLRTAGLPDLTDVLQVTEEIGDRCMQRHGGWRDYAIRVIPFLNRLREFAPIGDVIVGGAQNLAVSGVWAAVRLALEVSLSTLDFFDKVSEVMFRIGKSIRLNRDFATIFPQNDELQDLAYEYLATVVDMSTKIVRYAQKSAFSQIALLSSFNSTFKPLESQLQEIGLQIQARTAILSIQKDQESHSETQSLLSTIHMAASRERRKIALETEKRRVLSILCPDQGKFDVIYRYHRRKAHSAWMFEQSTYQRWATAKDSSVLWLLGNLGSGKSVVMASVVANLAQNKENIRPLGAILRADSPTTISYFFCTSSASKPTASAILGSIAYQSLVSTALSSSFSQYLHLHSEALDIRCEPKACIDLLLNTTPRDWNGFIVIDSLDDCSCEDVEILFKELNRLSRSRNIHLLCSSRTLWEHFNQVNTTLSASTVSIAIEDADRSSEVVSYIANTLEEWKSRFSLSPGSASLLQEQLWVGWAGMYLWLALQMAGITEDLDYGIPVGDIISNLPRDLPEAYDKALLRISDQGVASRIFRLVVAAENPLSFHELRIAADISPGEPLWAPMKRPMHVSKYLRQYGGHLLEADEDQKICFIHHSAVLHLLDSPVDPKARDFHFSLLNAKQYLGSVCVTYANLPELDQTISTYKKPLNLGQVDVPGAVVDSVALSHSRLKTAFRFLQRNHRENASSVEIDRLYAHLRTQQQPNLTSSEARVLLEYVQANWLKATRFLCLADPKVYRCWKRILNNRVDVITIPARLHVTSEAYTWAILNGHYALLQCLALEQGSTVHAQHTLETLSELLNTRPRDVRMIGPDLIPAVVRLLECGGSESFPIDALAQQIFNPLALAFTHDAHDASIALAQLKILAPIVMQVLIMYRGENISLISLLPYLVCLVHPTVELHRGKTAVQLAKEHDMPEVGMSIISQHGGPFIDALISYQSFLSDSTIRHIYRHEPFTQSLIFATLDANTECVKFLLEHGAVVDRVDKENRTALIQAAMKGSRYTECTELLLYHGADVNHQDLDGRVALHYATYNGNAETVKVLLDYGADPYHRDVHNNGMSALVHASRTGNFACFKVLSEHGPSTCRGTRGNRSMALYFASAANRAEYIEPLLDLGANIEFRCDDGTVLMRAMKINNPEVVSILIKRGADVHARGAFDRTALHIGVFHKSHQAVDVLLKQSNEINIDTQDGSAESALHIASRAMDVSLIRLLVGANASVSITNNFNNTPLDVLKFTLRITGEHDLEVSQRTEAFHLLS